MRRRRKFLKDAVVYSGSNLISNILNFISAIVVRRILAPVFVGLFNEAMLIFDYAQYSHLGILDAMDKELPYLYGKGEKRRAGEIKDVGSTVCLALAVMISATLFIASCLNMVASDALLALSLRVVALMIIIRMLSSLYVVANRSRHNFFVISAYTILVAVLDVTVKMALVIKFGLPGLLWGTFLTMGLGVLYFYFASGLRFRIILGFPVSDILSLLKIGSPIFITGFVFMTLRNMDRIMIIKLLGRESLGLYTIGLMASVYIVQLPNLIYAVIFPRFYRSYGERGDIAGVKDLFMKPMIIFAYLFPALIGLVILVLPLLVSYILPAYTAGLVPAYVLLLGCSFLALVNMPGYLLIILNKQMKMVAIGVVSIALSAAVIYILVRKCGLGLMGVAAGAGVSYFIYTTILLWCAFRNYTKNVRAHLAFFARMYIPVIWVFLLLFMLRAFVTQVSGSIVKDVMTVCVKAAIFTIGCAPLVWYAAKKTGIMSILRPARR